MEPLVWDCGGDTQCFCLPWILPPDAHNNPSHTASSSQRGFRLGYVLSQVCMDGALEHKHRTREKLGQSVTPCWNLNFRQIDPRMESGWRSDWRWLSNSPEIQIVPAALFLVLLSSKFQLLFNFCVFLQSFPKFLFYGHSNLLEPVSVVCNQRILIIADLYLKSQVPRAGWQSLRWQSLCCWSPKTARWLLAWSLSLCSLESGLAGFLMLCHSGYFNLGFFGHCIPRTTSLSCLCSTSCFGSKKLMLSVSLKSFSKRLLVPL